MRLENDGRIYASVAGTSTILAINTNLTTGFSLTLADTSILTGHLAQPVFKVVPAGDINHALYARSAGLKKYELKDHLGNVRVVVSDRLAASGALPGITNDAELLSYNHYYPFGMLQPGRNFAANTYRYRFNGVEKDDEVYGSTGTLYAFEYRMHDARIGRFWSADLLEAKYSFLSPFNFTNNNPIINREVDGKDWIITTTINNNGDKTVHMKLTVAIINSSSINNLDLNSIKAQTIEQLKKSYSISYKEPSKYETVNLYSGLDRPANNLPIITEFRNVNVEVDVEARIINKLGERREDEHLIQVIDENVFDNPIRTLGQVNEIGGRVVRLNARYIGGIQSGAFKMVLPHEFGHTLGLRHIDRKYETGFESFFKIENTDYRGPSSLFPNNLMLSKYKSGTLTLDYKQINMSIKNYEKGKINK
ncbi:MAG: RHS repeat-associated core domain-containing protein [Bacteroidales bacterium]